MAQVQGPLFSMGASGSLAGAVVYSIWKGRPYVRALVKPSNPKSGGQVGMRAVFQFLTQKWAALSAADKATWEARAAQTTVSPFNAFVSYNQLRWRNFTAPSQADPAAEVGTPPTEGTLAATLGVRSITITQPITAAADGWGIGVFRSLTASLTPTYDNLIGVGLVNGTNDVVWVDSPLVPDTYYYKIRSITDDGVFGSVSAEVNETVV